jgi:hypothetical protein
MITATQKADEYNRSREITKPSKARKKSHQEMNI